MKLITAIIKPFRLDDVCAALTDLGLRGMTLTEVTGFGRQMGHTEQYRGAEYTVDFQPKARIDVAVDDEETERAIDTIADPARTGKIGDGKIFETELPETVRICTGESGTQAL